MKMYYGLLVCVIVATASENYLFKKFPVLQEKVPYLSFCDLPTPIIKLHNLSKYSGIENIYMKRDDLTGKIVSHGLHLYGGNKPRKLEFLLADALKKNARTVVTWGAAGSNHALATAVYAAELGMRAILMLKDQPNSYIVRHNLLLDQYYDAQLHFFSENTARAQATDALLQDPANYFIPTGGSNALGAIGFVNAALELADQVARHEMPAPDMLYVAAGSCGTTAGLLLGLQVAQLPTQLVAVCISPAAPERLRAYIKKLFIETNELLHAHDELFPLYEFPDEQLIINCNVVRTEYGLYTPEVAEAITLFKDLENINLEGTYSAKPIVAILQDAQLMDLYDKTILFWNTYCGIDFSFMTNMHNYTSMPRELQSYFEEAVQPLAQR